MTLVVTLNPVCNFGRTEISVFIGKSINFWSRDYVGQTCFDFPINKNNTSISISHYISTSFSSHIIAFPFRYLNVLPCIAELMNSDFPFLYVCDLLEDLERLWNPEKGPPLLHTDKVARTSARFIGWLKSHCNELNACNAEDDPVSRMLRPESSTDRINGMNAEKLEHVIARVLMLPRVQVVELQKWRHSSLDGDLAACVERVVGIMNFVSFIRLIS